MGPRRGRDRGADRRKGTSSLTRHADPTPANVPSARRAGSPVSKPDQTRAPVLKIAVGQLRAIALAARPGDFLGSEEELRALLGVSRPTYRQAVQLLEHDQLLTKRMGPRGGCYASRPDPNSLSRWAALYLQIEKATLHDLLDVSLSLEQQTLTAACLSTDETARADLRAFLDALPGIRETSDQDWFLEQERGLQQLLLALADNPAMRLFFQITRKFVDDNPASKVLIGDAAMRRMRVLAWSRIGEAVLNRSVDEAREIARQQHSAFVSLLPGEALRGNAIGTA